MGLPGGRMQTRSALTAAGGTDANEERANSGAWLPAVFLLVVVFWPLAAEAADGFLEVQVEPAVVDVPKPEPQGRRHWKILASPTPKVIADEPFRATLQEKVDKAFTEDHPWIANLRSQWSLLGKLGQDMSGAQLKFTRAARADDPVAGRQVNHFSPPSAADGPVHLFIPFSYTLTQMLTLRIEVASATDATPAEVGVLDLPLPDELRGNLAADVANRISFRLRGKGREITPEERARLLKVAGLAFTTVANEKALPPRPVVDDATASKIALILRASIFPPPEAAKAIRFVAALNEPGVWVLTVEGIRPVKGARIEGRYELAGIVDLKSLDDRTSARLTARAGEISKELNERFAKDFKPLHESVVGAVLTPGEIDAFRVRLLKTGEDKIARVDEVRVSDAVLIVPVVIRPKVQILEGSGGIGYTPREGPTGTAGLTGQNLLSLDESVSLNAKGGPDNYGGDFDFGVPLPSRWWNDERLTARVSLHALYDHASDTTLGQPPNVSVTEEDQSVRLRQSVMFRPFAPRSAEPGKTPPASSSALGLTKNTAIGVDIELGRRDVNLSGITAPTGIPLDGIVAPLSATFRAITGVVPRDPASRVRSIDVRLESTLERSFEILGSDLPYQAWNIRASIEGVFWLFSATPRGDILLRYVHGYGDTSNDTPLFRFLRVGGEANVRGVEEGEFIGQRLQSQQFEAGVSLCSLGQLIFPMALKSDNPTVGECQAGSLDLSRAFLKAFFDHADVAERVAGSQFIRGSRSILGGGAAVELHDLQVGSLKLSLALGYAYSPDSQRHPSGTVFTQVILPFTLR